MKMIWIVFLYMAAGLDLWKREIPVWLYGVFGLVGIVNVVRNPLLLPMAGSIAIGLVLLLISFGSGGAVGDGDGWFFLVSGLYLAWQENLSLLCSGLLLSSLYAIGWIIWGKWNGVSVKHIKIPFLPFLLPMGIWMVYL